MEMIGPRWEEDGLGGRSMSPLKMRFYTCADIDDFDNAGKAQLNSRAWAMQERVLAQRTIHFSANQTYWECGKGDYCENLTRLKTSREYAASSLRLVSRLAAYDIRSSTLS